VRHLEGWLFENIGNVQTKGKTKYLNFLLAGLMKRAE